MVSKPCARGGCTNLITAKAHVLKRRVYCSISCSTQQRLANGWIPHSFITPEVRAIGARKGGQVAGERRHRRTLQKAVQACADLIPAEWRETYGAADLARIKVLLGRAYLVGQFKEKQRADSARRYAAKTQDRRKQGQAA
jgi:hypothetical protein